MFILVLLFFRLFYFQTKMKADLLYYTLDNLPSFLLIFIFFYFFQTWNGWGCPLSAYCN